MWIADGWKEYEVIDTSKGEKLERWGDYLLVRPDPQVIWDTPRKNRGWKHMNGHYHRSSRGGGEWEFFDLPHQWEIHYKDLTFKSEAFQFQTYGTFSGAGGKLGLVWREDKKCKKTGKGFKSFCIYRRCNTCGSIGRSECYTC